MKWGVVNIESKENVVIILYIYMVYFIGSCGFFMFIFVNFIVYFMLLMLRLVFFRKMVFFLDKIFWFG